MGSGSRLEHGRASSLKRIDFLDGFRGVAILLVLGYHYFSRFANEPIEYYPYGNVLASVPIFELGYNGVYLFFAVSGFVIAMTLSRTANTVEFAVRRFARLWPTMLICSIITYLVLWRWPIFWPQSPINFLPSLTFIDGSMVWGQLSPVLESQWIDGAYWTLFVEVRFYFIAGVVYFICPSLFSRNMGLLMLIVSGFYCSSILSGLAERAAIMDLLLIAPYLPWFIGGLAAYEIWRGGHRTGLLLSISSLGAIALLTAVDAPGASLFVALAIAGLFLLCMWSETISRLFSSNWLTVVGVSSYSLYLLHQNLGITLIAVLARKLGVEGYLSISLALGMSLLMIFFAFLVWRFWEQPLNRAIVSAYVRRGRRPSSRVEVIRK